MAHLRGIAPRHAERSAAKQIHGADFSYTVIPKCNRLVLNQRNRDLFQHWRGERKNWPHWTDLYTDSPTQCFIYLCV